MTRGLYVTHWEKNIHICFSDDICAIYIWDNLLAEKLGQISFLSVCRLVRKALLYNSWAVLHNTSEKQTSPCQPWQQRKSNNPLGA